MKLFQRRIKSQHVKLFRRIEKCGRKKHLRFSPNSQLLCAVEYVPYEEVGRGIPRAIELWRTDAGSLVLSLPVKVSTIDHPPCVTGRGQCPEEDSGGLYLYMARRGKGMPRPSGAKDRFDPDSVNVLLRDVQSRWFRRPISLP